MAILVVLATIGPIVWPVDPYGVDVLGALAPPSLEHPMGTDDVGRDIIARFNAGARISLVVATIVTLAYPMLAGDKLASRLKSVATRREELRRAQREAGLPFDTSDQLAQMAEDVYLPQLPPDEFPYLNEAAAALAAAGQGPDEEFSFGLELILGGLDGVRASAQPAG